MFYVIQSNDTHHLATILSFYYQTYANEDVFAPFLVITPAKVLEEWLKKTLAKQTGISALFVAKFWGQYQWQLIGEVLDAEANWIKSHDLNQEILAVPEVAMLSQSVMHWQIFAWLMQKTKEQTLAHCIVQDETHPLYFLFIKTVDEQGLPIQDKLWRLCGELASLYVKYLTQRPDWLVRWSNDEAVDVMAMVAKKDELARLFYEQDSGTTQKQDDDSSSEWATPEWLIAHYYALEQALRFVWHVLFREAYWYRHRLEERFWQILDHAPKMGMLVSDLLPKTLYLFTVQQLPPIELKFLERLSRYTDIVLLHYNPSKLFWADIVDKNWLMTQTIVRPDLVYLKEYGHGLLSRLGKSSRETFAMLAHLSGGEYYQQDNVKWQDVFVSPIIQGQNPSLLQQLKHDILMLEEYGVQEKMNESWFHQLANKISQPNRLSIEDGDDSLLIHSCHSLKRQLEVARMLIGKWLNQVGADGQARQLSDIAIMLPDVESHSALIGSVFGHEVGLDGLRLPAKITGVSNQAVRQLWQALVGFYELPVRRFYADELFSWLLLPSVYENFGLSFEQAKRACDLLSQAGFIRGLDAMQLQTSLDKNDQDYRHSFAYALDRLTASWLFGNLHAQNTGIQTVGVFYPFDWRTNEQFFGEKTPLLPLVGLDDEVIIRVLCLVYEGFCQYRHAYDTYDGVLVWLDKIEYELIDRYFFAVRHSEAMRAIFEAKNELRQSVLANIYYQKKYGQTNTMTPSESPKLPLSLVLSSLADKVLKQQISAEPSGVILFARFGAVRTIPFRLVIMLGMNLSEFPRQDSKNRLDLTKAGTARLGDRHHEDDDNGAFLEAMLSAQENCWIFYDGQGIDGTLKLPAVPVSELMQFVGEQLDDKVMDGGLSLEQRRAWLEQVLIKKHPPLPFHHTVFEYDQTGQISVPTYPPPPLWQGIYWAMQDKQPTKPYVAWYDDSQIKAWQQVLVDIEQGVHVLETHPTQTQLYGVIGAHKNFAKAFFRGKVAITDFSDITLVNEQLILTGLDKYALNHQLLTQSEHEHSLADSYFANLTQLPAGVSRFATLVQAKTQMQALQAMLMGQLQALDLCDEVLPSCPIQTQGIDVGGQLLAVLPNLSCNNPHHIAWHVSPSSPKAYHHLSSYLYHLAWQVLLGDDRPSNKPYWGASFWQYLPDEKSGTSNTFVFLPITGSLAKRRLAQFVYLARVGSHIPVLLTPVLAFSYAKQLHQNAVDFDGLLKDFWRIGERNYEGLNDSYWWALVRGYDGRVEKLLEQSLTLLAPCLYDGLLEVLQVVQDGVVMPYMATQLKKSTHKNLKKG